MDVLMAVKHGRNFDAMAPPSGWVASPPSWQPQLRGRLSLWTAGCCVGWHRASRAPSWRPRSSLASRYEITRTCSQLIRNIQRCWTYRLSISPICSCRGCWTDRHHWPIPKSFGFCQKISAGCEDGPHWKTMDTQGGRPEGQRGSRNTFETRARMHWCWK